ncbi:MAG: hypothetical protein ABIN55_02345 [Aeromicrobium sp.]
MNRIIRNLVIAVPLATVGLTMVSTGAANAELNDPMIIVQPEPPKPPKPGFDNDLPIKDAPKPQGPKDLADAPKNTSPKPQGGNQVNVPGTVVETVKSDKVAAEVVSAKGSPDSIDRSDALVVAGPAETTLVANESDNGMDLTWLLIGGGIVTASGIAFAARKRTSV